MHHGQRGAIIWLGVVVIGTVVGRVVSRRCVVVKILALAGGLRVDLLRDDRNRHSRQIDARRAKERAKARD